MLIDFLRRLPRILPSILSPGAMRTVPGGYGENRFRAYQAEALLDPHAFPGREKGLAWRHRISGNFRMPGTGNSSFRLWPPSPAIAKGRRPAFQNPPAGYKTTESEPHNGRRPSRPDAPAGKSLRKLPPGHIGRPRAKDKPCFIYNYIIMRIASVARDFISVLILYYLKCSCCFLQSVLCFPRRFAPYRRARNPARRRPDRKGWSSRRQAWSPGPARRRPPY